MALDDKIGDLLGDQDAEQVAKDIAEAISCGDWIQVMVTPTRYLGAPCLQIVYESDPLGVASVLLSFEQHQRISVNNDPVARGSMYLLAGVQSLVLANMGVARGPGEDDDEDEEDESLGDD